MGSRPEVYDIMYAMEDSYWWYRGLRRIAFSLLERYYPSAHDLTILEAGCGTGGFLQQLANLGWPLGLDRSSDALKYCVERGIPPHHLMLGSTDTLPYRPELFDLITCIDVLCCLDDDAQALKEFHRVLKPGGRLLLNLPALEILGGEHDRAWADYVHRYTAGELRSKLERAGFIVERLTYINTILFPIALFVRLRKRLLSSGNPSGVPSSDLKPLPPFLNEILVHIFGFEATLLKFMSFPIGVSLIAVVKKP